MSPFSAMLLLPIRQGKRKRSINKENLVDVGVAILVCRLRLSGLKNPWRKKNLPAPEVSLPAKPQAADQDGHAATIYWNTRKKRALFPQPHFCFNPAPRWPTGLVTHYANGEGKIAWPD